MRDTWRWLAVLHFVLAVSANALNAPEDSVQSLVGCGILAALLSRGEEKA